MEQVEVVDQLMLLKPEGEGGGEAGRLLLLGHLKVFVEGGTMVAS
jgi:hypothetical protein